MESIPGKNAASAQVPQLIVTPAVWAAIATISEFGAMDVINMPEVMTLP